MAAQMDPKELKRLKRLRAAIGHHRNDIVQTLFDEGLDVNTFDKDVEPGDGLGETPLNVAIMSGNQWAFDELLKRGANVRKQGGSRREPLIIAAAVSNEDMTVALLAKGVPANVFSGDNALGYAITGISNYALEKFGSWSYGDKPVDADDPSLHKEISHFYHQTENYKQATVKGAKPVPLHRDHDKKSTRVYFKGNLDLIALLLSQGVSPSTIAGDRNILMILENPTKYHNNFTVDSGIEYVGATGDILTFKIQFGNHGRECPFEVFVDYDLTQIKTLVFGHHKANGNNRSDAHLLGVTADINRLKDELSEDIHQKTTRLHKEVLGIDEKLQSEAKHAAEHRQQVSPLLVRDFEKATLKAREQAIAKHPTAESFRAKFRTQLNATIDASIVLSSGKVESTHDNIHNKAGKVLEFMGPHIPIVGSVVGLLGKGLEYYGDKKEEKACKKIASFFGGDPVIAAKFTQKLAIRLTEHCEFLQHLSLAPKEIDKLADNLMTQVCLSILGTEEGICYATSTNKNKIEEDIVIATIESNKTLKHYFDKLHTSHPGLIVVAHEHKKDELKKRSSDYKTEASAVTAAMLAAGTEGVSGFMLAQGYARFKAAVPLK